MWIKCFYIIAIAVVGTGILRGNKSVKTYFELRKSLKILEDTVLTLKKENEKLKLEIIKIKNSPSYAQKVLKDKYHLKEDSEKIIFFAD